MALTQSLFAGHPDQLMITRVVATNRGSLGPRLSVCHVMTLMISARMTKRIHTPARHTKTNFTLICFDFAVQ